MGGRRGGEKRTRPGVVGQPSLLSTEWLKPFWATGGSRRGAPPPLYYAMLLLCYLCPGLSTIQSESVVGGLLAFLCSTPQECHFCIKNSFLLPASVLVSFSTATQNDNHDRAVRFSRILRHTAPLGISPAAAGCVVEERGGVTTVTRRGGRRPPGDRASGWGSK